MALLKENVVNQERPALKESSASFKALVAHLRSLETGEVQSPDEVESLLRACWHEFEGGGEEGMGGNKLKNRTEVMTWNPPVLSFRIERHGRTTNGSIYADLHQWHVDVERMEASLDETKRKRQVGARAQPVNVAPIAEEIAELIKQGREDTRIRWRGANCVKVNFKETIPEGVNWTFNDRKKRFKVLLSSALASEGWQGGDGGVWTRNPEEE